MNTEYRSALEVGKEAVHLRRELHQEPEIGLHLPRTQEKILAVLSELPLEVTLGKNCSSITAVLRGTKASTTGLHSPSVLLRADMDGLPVQEQSGADYTSRIDGAMHACGHDLHMAMLVGAATLLSDSKHQLAGDVVFMFQPGEEGYDGASVMIDEGVLDASGRRAEAAYGLHVWSSGSPQAQFLTKPGTVMSASDRLLVRVTGRGGHGSAPHKAKDPLSVGAEMVTALQTMVTRQFDIFDPAVVSVGVFNGGTASNIIPDFADFEATVRTFSESAQRKMEASVTHLLQGIAAAHNVEVDVRYQKDYPMTVNNAFETDFAEGQLAELFDAERFTRLAYPLSASEDFSRVLKEVPGSFIGLSALAPGMDPSAAPFNHSPYATFNDDVLTDGIALFSKLATARLDLASKSYSLPSLASTINSPEVLQ